MNYKKLIIGTIIIKNSKIILGTSFYDEKTVNWSRKTSPKEIEQLYHNKKICIIKDDTDIICNIISTSVSNSISDYKSVFFETDLITSNDINENDLIKII